MFCESCLEEEWVGKTWNLHTLNAINQLRPVWPVDHTGLTGKSEFKLIFLNRQSSSQNICNEVLEIFRDEYTQYLLNNRAHSKI
jgi:hypothetical protein